MNWFNQHGRWIGLLIALLFGSAFGQSNRITTVEIKGLKNVNQMSVTSAMRLKPGEIYTDALRDQDKKNLEAMGLFSKAEIRTAVEEGVEGTGTLKVIVELEENPLIKVARFSGNTALTELELLEKLRNKPGLVLNFNNIRPDAIALREAYQAKGYVVEVEGYEMVPGEDGVLAITLQELKLGNITISGNSKTKERIIRREFRSKPGDLFNLQRWQRDLTRLYNTGFFESLEPEENPVAPGVVDVNLLVKERPTGRINVGFALDSRQRLVGLAELYETNFRGSGQTVGVNFQSTGTAQGNSIELSFTEPYLDSRETSLSVSVYNKLLYRFTSNFFGGNLGQDQEQRYDERRRGISLSVGRPLGETLSAAISLRTEDVKTNRVATDSNTGFIRQDGSITSISFRATQNTRDFDLDPATGQFLSVSLEPGISNIRDVEDQFLSIVKLGRSNFVRSSADLRYYFSPQGRRTKPDDRRQVFAARIFYGNISGNVPFFEQFFVGGAETLRGYQEDRFWGKNSLIFSLEFRIPVEKAFTAVLFADWGDAWGGYPTVNNFTQHNNFKPQLGLGIGVRVRTPLGPIRIDYGIGKDGGRTHFSVGQVF